VADRLPPPTLDPSQVRVRMARALQRIANTIEIKLDADLPDCVLLEQIAGELEARNMTPEEHVAALRPRLEATVEAAGFELVGPGTPVCFLDDEGVRGFRVSFDCVRRGHR
jgi:hypothetical protein